MNLEEEFRIIQKEDFTFEEFSLIRIFCHDKNSILLDKYCLDAPDGRKRLTLEEFERVKTEKRDPKVDYNLWQRGFSKAAFENLEKKGFLIHHGPANSRSIHNFQVTEKARRLFHNGFALAMEFLNAYPNKQTISNGNRISSYNPRSIDNLDGFMAAYEEYVDGSIEVHNKILKTLDDLKKDKTFIFQKADKWFRGRPWMFEDNKELRDSFQGYGQTL